MINVYENISPNRNSPRNHKVDRITIHAMSGHMTAKACCDMFANPERQASANYCIGKDGDIAISVPLTDRSWCSSSSINDNASVTIEVSSDSKAPYKFDDMAYLVCIDLVVNVMKFYNKNKLVYFGNREDAESYIIKDNEMLLTKHNFYAPKSCPGPWFEAKIPEFINEVHKRLGVNEIIENQNKTDEHAYTKEVLKSLKDKIDSLFKVYGIE